VLLCVFFCVCVCVCVCVFKHTSKRNLTKSHCMSMVDAVLMRSCARGAHGVCRQCPGLRRLALLVQACRGSASQHMRTRHDDEIDDNADVDAKDTDDDDDDPNDHDVNHYNNHDGDYGNGNTDGNELSMAKTIC
jgi:hypothetical protein